MIDVKERYLLLFFPEDKEDRIEQVENFYYEVKPNCPGYMFLK